MDTGKSRNFVGDDTGGSEQMGIGQSQTGRRNVGSHRAADRNETRKISQNVARRPMRPRSYNVTVRKTGPSFLSMVMAVVVGTIVIGILFVAFLGCGVLSLVLSG